MSLEQELQRQLDEARREIRRYQNSHYILALELEQYRPGNTHPDHLAFITEARLATGRNCHDSF